MQINEVRTGRMVVNIDCQASSPLRIVSKKMNLLCFHKTRTLKTTQTAKFDTSAMTL